MVCLIWFSFNFQRKLKLFFFFFFRKTNVYRKAYQTVSTFNFRKLKFKWVKVYYQCVVYKLHREFQSLSVQFYPSSHIRLFATSVDCSTQGFYMLTPGACSNISVYLVMPSKISYSVIQYFITFHLSNFRSFLMSQLCASDGQGWAAASASVPPIGIPNWFPLGLMGWSPCSTRDSRVFSNTAVQKHEFFGTQPFYMEQLSYPYMTT